MINLYLGIVCIFIINHFGEAMGGSDLVDFVWMGGLTKDGVVVKMSLMEILEERFYLQVEYFGRKWTFNGNAVKENSMLYEFHVTGLPASGIVYEYRILLENEMVYLGKFELPKVLEVYNFTFAFSSCQDETSDPKVYESIGVHEPLFFAHLGDLHYDNIDFEDSLLAYRSGYLNALHAPAGKAMLGMKVPMVYMYDDHDFGPDNSDKTAPGRKYALQTYREYVPHYPLHTSMEKGGGAVFQEFVIGRVLFLLTDLRSMRTPNGDVDSKKKTVLGKLQKKWFKDMIDAVMKKPHKDITTIVWCSTMPWLDDERKWGHFKYEQAEIVQFLKTYQKKKKLYIISGDAHMIAVDDGTNSPGNIPVFHAAALGRPGTIKGGPYSHGAFPGNGQFGIMKVVDSKERTCLEFSGRDIHNQEIVTYDTCNPAPGAPYHPPPVIIRKLTRAYRKIHRRFVHRVGKYAIFLVFTPLVVFAIVFFTICTRSRSSKKLHKA